ncbi:MAG: pyridoxal phosphate-dependent aminotransferase [Candidatus Bathyarchaeota archaeon]|nr:MAG: pyridoxal phosphate-dependent aminotransferase [Candidatus Bathyarchaeota archaeon]
MKHSSYLEWYIQVPKVQYDFRSSGVTRFKCDLALAEIDLSINYARGNPKTSELLAQRYHVQPESVFISSEGASGQNTRIIRYIAETNERKNEAIVEYPTYEPLLRKVQEHFPRVKRLEREPKEAYSLNADALADKVSDRTGLLVLTNPHAPSGAISGKRELEEIMTIAHEHEFPVLCDEIYAEFDRDTVPTIFSISPELGIVATSFTKAYGLGGLKLGVALARENLVDGLYTDVLNTVGNSPNIVQLIAAKLLTKGGEKLDKHKQKWMDLRRAAEEWLSEKRLEYFPNKTGVTFWVDLPIKDTYKWINQQAIPRYGVAAVPGTLFLFRHGHKLMKSNKIRLGLGNINPHRLSLAEAFEALEKALDIK